MAQTFIALATYKKSYSLPTNDLLVFTIPKDGTLTRLAVFSTVAPTGDEATFDLKKNGVTALGAALSLPDGDSAAEDVISVAVVEGDLITVDLLTLPSEIGDVLSVYVDFEVAGGGGVSASGVKVNAPSTNLTLANGFSDYITWDNGEARDDGGWFDVGGDEQVITAPITGWVDVEVHFGFATGAGGKIEVTIEHEIDIVAIWRGVNSATEQVQGMLTAKVYATAGDEFRVAINNLSGGSMTTAFGAGLHWWAVLPTGRA